MHRVAATCTPLSQQDLRVLLGLWGSLRRYQITSILEILSRNLDEGLAILRMATELAKTLKAISANAAFYVAWTRGVSSSAYEKAARLDPGDPVEKAVFAAYTFCTKYGAHGHKTSAAYLVDTFMGKEPSLNGVAATAKAWFVHYVPIHRLCLKCCADNSSDLFVECNLILTVVEAKLLERVLNDAFFKFSSEDVTEPMVG